MNITNTFQGEIRSDQSFPGLITGAGSTTNFYNYAANSGHPTHPQQAGYPGFPCHPGLGQKASVKRVHTIPFRRNKAFVDREDISKWLEQRIQDHGDRAALAGLGGVGKSQIAISYSYRKYDESPETSVFWVHAGSFHHFKDAYRTIADKLKLPERSNPDVDILKLVYEWLCDEDNGPWLMIVDNADDAKIFFADDRTQPDDDVVYNHPPLASFLPQTGCGSIIITSRSKRVAAKLATLDHVFDMPRMEETQAYSLLQNKLGPALSKDDMKNLELIEALDFMPLAIVQAASFIRERGQRSSVESYLATFRESDKKKTTLLKTPAIGELLRLGDASNAIITTWRITFDQICKERPSAAQLLCFMSFFNPQGIPDFALHGSWEVPPNKWPKKYNPEDFEEDNLVLRAYSLISTMEQADMFAMHALVGFCTQQWILELGSEVDMKDWRLGFMTQLSSVYPMGSVEVWEKCGKLNPHVQSLLKEEPSRFGDIIAWYRLCIGVSNFHIGTGGYREAEKILRRAIAHRDRRWHSPSAMDNTTMEACWPLSMWLSMVLTRRSNHQEAQDYAYQAYNWRVRLHGPNDLRAISLLADVVKAISRQDMRDKQLEAMLHESFERAEKEHGCENKEVVNVRAKIALLMTATGRFAEAEKLHRQVLESRKETLGLKSVMTNESMNNLATALRRQGKFDEAVTIQRTCVAQWKTMLRPDDPTLLKCQANLGLALEGQGNHDEAEKLHKAVLKIAIESRDNHLEKVEEAFDRVVAVLQAQGKDEEAQEADRRREKWVKSGVISE